MPRLAFEQFPRRPLAIMGLYGPEQLTVVDALPPFREVGGGLIAEGDDVGARLDLRWRRQVDVMRPILEFAFDVAHEDVRHLIGVVGEIPERPVAVRDGAMAELVDRDLGDERLLDRQHLEPARHKLDRRQALGALRSHADKARHLIERLPEDEFASPRHDRQRSRAKTPKVGRAFGVIEDVDGFEGHPEAGQKLLHLDAGGATRLPVDPDRLRVHQRSPLTTRSPAPRAGRSISRKFLQQSKSIRLAPPPRLKMTASLLATDEERRPVAAGGAEAEGTNGAARKMTVNRKSFLTNR